jgi:murein DD-endopeptidase MepM/ murein hydrolase activator NlpD
MKFCVAFSVLCVIFLSCRHQSHENDMPLSVEAKYVLPYPVGRVYTCLQGFNNSYSHNGTFRYAVDFAMPIGTFITATRSGHVAYVLESYSDNDRTAGHENVVIVMHEDSTYARYVHLTTNGALVATGQTVMPGDTIGLSGNSGSSGPPHLHFDVTNANTGRSDQTIPFDFKNTMPHPVGLRAGVLYKAFPY